MEGKAAAREMQWDKWPLCCGHEEDDGRAGSERPLLGDEAVWEKGEKPTLTDPEWDTSGVMVPGDRDA